MGVVCTIEFDNTENGSFQLICSRDSDIKWIDVLDSDGRSSHIYPGNAYSVSDMYYNWYIIAEAVTGASPYSEYKIIGVFTKNSDYLVGIFLTSNGYTKLEMNYAELTTIRIADIEDSKINSDYNCTFNTDNETNVDNSEDTIISIEGKVLNINLDGWTYYNNDSVEVKCDEGIIKYVFNLTQDLVSNFNQPIDDIYTAVWGDMYIIFNSVTNEICAIVVFDNRSKSIHTYHISTHDIYQRPVLTSAGSSTAFQTNEIDIQGYYTVYVTYPDGANIDITNTEA